MSYALGGEQGKLLPLQGSQGACAAPQMLPRGGRALASCAGIHGFTCTQKNFRCAWGTASLQCQRMHSLGFWVRPVPLICIFFFEVPVLGWQGKAGDKFPT